MTTTIELPKPGDEVVFIDNGARCGGVCNGEPQALGKHGDAITHIPVYVHDGDRCMMVHVTNLRSL